MTREQLARSLALLVRRGALTTDEARQVLRAYDAGEIPPALLPLEAAVALDTSRQDRREEAWLLLLLLLGIAPPMVNRLRVTQQRRARELLLDRTMALIATAAARMSSVGEWQRRMSDILGDTTTAQATAGAGRPLTDAQLGRAQAANRRNLAFLALFAVHIMARAVLGKPMGFTGIKRRAALYAGVGRAEFFRAAEDGLPRGWVVRYISRDDPATCGACSQYHRTVWLPHDGPYPGDVCYGAGRCRCERMLEYNPAEWSRLTGQVF